MASDSVFKNLYMKLSVSMTAVLTIFLAALIISLNVFLDTSNLRSSNKFMDMIAAAGGLGPGRTAADNSDGGRQGTRRPRDNSRHDGKSGTDTGRKSRRLRLADIIFLHSVVPGFRNFCALTVDAEGSVIKVIHPFSLLPEGTSLDTLAKEIFERKDYRRNVYHKYGFKVSEKDSYYLMVLLDRRAELLQERRFARVSLAVFFLGILIAYMLSWFFSRWAALPAEEAYKRQRQFIADAGHELKTPIAVIGANIDVLEHEIPDNKWLGYIKIENSRMENLVKDLLYLARNDSERTETGRLPFDACRATAYAALPFEGAAFEQKKNFRISIPEQSITVTGDEEKIKQAVIILIDNALKNSDAGESIEVRVTREGRFCCITVYNTGRGIPEKDREKIFDRFYRADSSRARATGGYGLGLAIAKSIAVSHRGKISVESEEGKFASFTISLPADGK